METGIDLRPAADRAFESTTEEWLVSRGATVEWMTELIHWLQRAGSHEVDPFSIIVGFRLGWEVHTEVLASDDV